MQRGDRLRRFATVALAWACLACDAAGPPRWNVLLVTLDTTRADHLGCYGDAGAHTPHFDALADEGVRFDQAWTAAPITAPAHATLLTGRYPVAHGVRDNGLFVLPAAEETLAERLASAGWATGAAVGAFPLAARFGFGQGFGWYDDRVGARFGPAENAGRLFFDERPAGAVNEAAWSWLDESAADPFFLWLHYYDPHQPVAPPGPWNELFAANPYAGEIAYADESFGAVVARLRELGVWDRTLVVVTADHGEGLGEHEEATHSLLLYEGTLRVPWIVRVPGEAGGRVVEEPVSTVDLAPTVLDLLGLERPGTLHGKSLVPLLRGEGPLPARGLYAETLSPELAHRWGALRAWREGDLKYIHGPRPELYDLSEDARELAPLTRGDVAAELRENLAGFLAEEAQAVDAAQHFDAETRLRLEALGYAVPGDAGSPEIRDVLASGGVAPQDRARDVSAFSLAKALLLAGEAEAALAPLERLVAEDPGNPRYRELRAEAWLGAGALDAARSDLEAARAAAASPAAEAALLLRMAAVERARGDRASANALLLDSAALVPSAAAERLRAQLALEAGDAAETHAALERALVLEPGFAPARVLLAIELDRAGEAAAAEREFERALSDQPYDSRAYYNYGVFLLGRERLPESHAALTRSVALDPRYDAAIQAADAVALALGHAAPPPEASPILAAWQEGAVTQAELDGWIRELPFADRRLPDEPEARRSWTRRLLRARALHEMLVARALSRDGEALASIGSPAPAPSLASPALGERRLVHHWYRRARDAEALAAARAELDALAERFAAGEPFEALARAHSESQSRHVGGALGWLSREQLPAAAAAAVFSLRAGDLSEPVLVGPGLHVFRVEQVLAARAPAEHPGSNLSAAADPGAALREVARREQARVLRERVSVDVLREWHARHPLRFATPLALQLERTWVPAGSDPDAEMAWLEDWVASEPRDPTRLAGHAIERGGGSEELPWQSWAKFSFARPLAALLVARLETGEISPPYRSVSRASGEILEVMRVLGRREPQPQSFEAVADEVMGAWLATEGATLWQAIADEWLEAAGYRESAERSAEAPGSTWSSSSARSS